MATKILPEVNRRVPVSEPPKPGAAQRLAPLWLISVPMLLFVSLALTVPRISETPRLEESFWGAAAGLLIFLCVLGWRAARTGRTLKCEVVLNKVHYVQLTMHTCVYSYWGWYWREVYHYVPLIAGQIAFAYALDMLVCWSRREKWILGFGPIPIILSTNLFLWFRDDWFFLQFAMIATGVLGKEFIKWKREGRLTHIFNPSALALFIFSVALIATKHTDITWGIDISDTLHRPPHIYLEIFLLGLVVQSLFRVTLITLWAAVALCALNLAYTRMTGDYNFVDSSIPVSVFLGLHLLVTDPATSPRKSFGKILFGLMYGAGVFGMYRFLSLIGAPEFYDKLLCVPALNLSVRALDRLSNRLAEWFRARFSLRALNPRNANFAWMAVWASLFATMTASGFLTKGKDHPGGDPAHWLKACQEGRWNACKTWVRVLNVNCQDDSQADCLTLGKTLNEGKLVPRDAAEAGISFGHACDLGVGEGCTRLLEFARSDGKDAFFKSCNDGTGASCFILGSLVSSGTALPKDDSLAFRMFSKSCEVGWWRGCGRLGISYLVGQGTAVDPSKAMENFEKGCRGQNAASCFEAAKLYHEGIYGVTDQALAQRRLKQACELGLKTACH
jgi:TPR repeat protein